MEVLTSTIEVVAHNTINYVSLLANTIEELNENMDRKDVNSRIQDYY